VSAVQRQAALSDPAAAAKVGPERGEWRLRPGARRLLRRDAMLFLLMICGYVAVGGLVRNSYYQLMFTLVPIWGVLGLSWNVFSGYSGLISFGHAAFIGVGAYTVALSATYLGVSPWLGIPAGAVIGAIAAVLIGLPTFRLRGHYFALAMLAYPLVMLYVLQYLGFQEMPLPMHRQHPAAWLQFGDGRITMLVAAGLLVIAMAVSMLVEHSRFGLSLMALRQNELAAEAAGLNARRLKMTALAISGAMAAAGGGLYACVLLVVTPDAVFGMLTSAQALVIPLFGGVGTYWGPLIGAAVLIPLSEMLQAQIGDIVPGIQGVVYGAAIILIMLLAPDGVFWSVRDRWLRRRPAARAVEPGTAGPGALEPVAGLPTAAIAMSGGAHLRVQGLSRAFGGLRAVDDVSLDARPGRILGIIGPNGAGKTTLFNLINGVLRADAGAVTLDGEDMRALRLHRVARAGIGRTFQVVRSFPRLSLLDNVIVGAYGAGLRGAEAAQMASAALDRTGLRPLAALPAGALTNKQLRLMELARALAGQPRVLLLDEILAGLGHDECVEVLAVLQRLRTEGVTVVIIEHTMHAMLRIADEFVVIDHGRVLARGLPRDVIEDTRVIEAYLGSKWAARCST
jgi:ABC-type branched-subunit amino acid transport system ATPase component/ABC-type branched-subunit amino acid transport system permease subunit